MEKDKGNVRKQYLIEGQKTCNNEDLLTECINMCEKIRVKCISQGEQTVKKKQCGGKMTMT